VSLDPAAVADAVDEVARIIRADGGDLVLVAADAATLRISLELRLDGVSCADCVLPPDRLRSTIEAAIARRVPGEFELVVDDPRR
jgi:Fe-S cluster biogenesis protein NfuA